MLLQADAVPPSLSTGPRASLDGGVQTRLDSPWPSTGSTQGFGREQDTGNAASLRARARRLEIVNWLASGVLDRAVENVIGTTFRVEPMTGDKQFDGRARRWWRRWWNSSACDLRGMFTGGALLRQAYRAKLRDGDVLIVLATVEGQINGRTIRIPKLQIIEGERIKNPTQAVDGRLPGGNQITEGVEMDDNGRPIAYWVEWADRNGVHHYERVESRDAIFLHRTTRSSFVRGESAFRGGFLLFEQIMGYLDSVIVAARVGASQAIIAKKKNPAADLRALQVLNPSGVSVASQQRVMPIQPGAINFVGIDEDLVAFNPAQPQQQFPDALDAFCRILGTKFGLTLEQVLLNFSKVTFHAGRAARIQAEATAAIEQEETAVMAVSRIYHWAISIAVENGEIAAPVPENFWDHEWIPSTRPWVDPAKELKAAETAVKLGVDARRFIAAGMGYHFPDLVEANAGDRELMKAAGLPLIEDAKTQPVLTAESPEDAKRQMRRLKTLHSMLMEDYRRLSGGKASAKKPARRTPKTRKRS